MLFWIDYDVKSTLAYAWGESTRQLTKAICPECGRDVSTEIHSSITPHILVNGGPEYPDFLAYNSWGSPLFLVSERVLNVFEQHHVAGYSSTIKVEVEPVDKRATDTFWPNYYQIVVNGKVDLDLKAMHLKRKRVCALCNGFDWSRTRLDPYILDMETWDQSDLCSLATFPRIFLCTEKVLNLYKSQKWTGIRFFPESDYYKRFYK